MATELRWPKSKKAPFGAFLLPAGTRPAAFLCVFFRGPAKHPNFGDSAGISLKFRPKSRDFGRNPDASPDIQ